MALGSSVDLVEMAGWSQLSSMSGAELTGLCRDAAFQALTDHTHTRQAAEQLAVLTKFLEDKLGMTQAVRPAKRAQELLQQWQVGDSVSPATGPQSVSLSESVWSDLCQNLQEQYGESPPPCFASEHDAATHQCPSLRQHGIGRSEDDIDDTIYVEKCHFEHACAGR